METRVGVKSSAFLGGRQVFSIGNVNFSSAVAQSHAKCSYFIERVRGIRNTSSMGTTKRSLAQTHPALANEADGWDPNLVTSGSAAKLDWRCKAGHSYSATVANRTSLNRGCPVCAGKKIVAGVNDLGYLYPEIAKQAKGWDPSEVSPGSHKKFLWVCEMQHEWLTAPQERIRGRGCPVCAGKQILIGFNDLASKFPELAQEADGWDPTGVTVGSGKKLSWKCSLGHSWIATVVSRTSSNTGCSICDGKQIQIGFNDLASKFPELAKEADGWDPTKFHFGTPKKMAWVCIKGHRWETQISDRTKKGYGCPVCSNQRLQVGYNDLATTHPEIAIQADGWDPTSIVAGDSKKFRWKCQKGHSWEAASSSRTTNGAGCPVCVNQQLLVGYNDLATTHPEIAKQADGWDPATVFAGTHLRKPWICNKGHRWTSTVQNRSGQNPESCPICSGKQVLAGFNDLASLFPDIAKFADGWDPREYTPGSNKNMSWKCELGHKWKTAVHSLTLQGTGCPTCSGQQFLVGFNDLATSHPEIAKEAFGWDPQTVGKSSDLSLKWKCPEGHVYETVVYRRALRGDKCSICSGKQVLDGFNDLRTTHPDIAKQADGWDPKKFTAGSNVKVRWKCPEGHKWTAMINSVSNSKHLGCPSCAIGGFDPNLKGYLYFLSHPSWEMLQIGITNYPEDRLQKHRKLGWELLEIRGPMDGHLTQQWETAILRMLKAKGADLSNSKVAGKFDGYSEAWTKSTFEVISIIQLMNLTEEFEAGKIN